MISRFTKRFGWRRQKHVSAILLAATTVALLYVRVPSLTLLGEELWDLGHVLLFGLLAWLCLHWRNWQFVTPQRVFLLLAAAALLALITELSQLSVGRDFAFRDITYDLAGVALVLLYRTKLRGSRRAALTVIIALPILTPMLWVLTAYGIALSQWPVLLDVDQVGSGVWVNSDAQVERVPSVGQLLRFRELKYSGFYVTAVEPDWRNYANVKLAVTNINSSPIILHCHVSDRRYAPKFREFRRPLQHGFRIATRTSPVEDRIGCGKIRPGVTAVGT